MLLASIVDLLVLAHCQHKTALSLSKVARQFEILVVLGHSLGKAVCLGGLDRAHSLLDVDLGNGSDERRTLLLYLFFHFISIY